MKIEASLVFRFDSYLKKMMNLISIQFYFLIKKDKSLIRISAEISRDILSEGSSKISWDLVDFIKSILQDIS
jgi:hypothetical protein